MRTIETTFNTFGASVLLIGLRGDSNATEIQIDCADALAEYQGTMAAMSITGPDETVYPGDISLDANGIVHWVVAARDCGIAGHGSARIDLVNDQDVVVASAEARTIIMKTNMQGIAPDQIANWTEAASVALQEVRAALLDLIGIDNTATANEAARVLAETGRVSAETLRASAETARASAETARATAETDRASAETARATAETARASAETARIAAETARVSEFSTMQANAQAALSYIGPSEASSTASASHAAGSYFIYNGKLYQATADIDIGDTITPGTNCAQVPGGAMSEVTDLKSALSDISRSNKNLWDADASVTFTKSKSVSLTTPIPAGTYVLSALVTSSDTDKTVSRFAVNGGSLTKDLSRGERASAWFTTASEITSITFYASQNTSTSEGDTATWANIQIEEGKYASDYVPHKLIANDEIARNDIARLVKYVSTSGNDANSGNSSDDAYATIAYAIASGADTIMVANGTYTENVVIPENQQYRYGKVRIIGDNATLITKKGINFRLANVEISGMHFDVSNSSESQTYGLLLLNCTGKVTDCSVTGATGAGGFRLDGSKMTLIRCVAHDNSVDGFNGHTLTTGYETEITLIDCIAYNNGDDGASVHENGKMFVIGGEYYNNVQTGLAPHNFTEFEAINVHCHDNGIGIEAVQDSLQSGETPATGRVIGCILNNNGTYGLDVKNYIVNTLGNGYANNTSGSTHAGTGATINAYAAS